MFKFGIYINANADAGQGCATGYYLHHAMSASKRPESTKTLLSHMSTPGEPSFWQKNSSLGLRISRLSIKDYITTLSCSVFFFMSIAFQAKYQQYFQAFGRPTSHLPAAQLESNI